jgi:cation diffusion facilitator family transporter
MSDKIRYVLLIFIAIVSTIVEGYGSDESGSWALLTDAVHMATHAVSAVLGIIGVYAIERNKDTARLERSIRLFNAIFLFGLGAWIGVYGLLRLLEPVPINGAHMMWFALFSLVSDCLQFWVGLGLKDAHAEHTTFKSQIDHLRGDVYNSTAVLVGAIGISLLGWRWLDTAAALFGAWKILKMGMHTWKTVDDPHAGHAHGHHHGHH